MKTSDLAAVPLGLLSAIRGRRVFHPDGVLARGSIERLAPPDEGLPVASSDVIIRISKAIGFPDALPDIIGLAIRMPPARPATTPWDVLLASVIGGTYSRFALRPVMSWSATLSTLMPLTFHGQTWWMQVQMTTHIDQPGLSLGDVADQLQAGEIEFVIKQARGFGRFTPLARLSITTRIAPGPSNDIAFDPTINSEPDVKLTPGWLTDVRRQAYARSRQGRGALSGSLSSW